MLRRVVVLDTTRWIAGSRGYATLDFKADAREQLGPPHWVELPGDHVVDGQLFISGPPAPERGWVFEAPCGLQFVARQWFFQNQSGDEERYELELEATCRSELEHALGHLPLTARIIGFDSACPDPRTGWAVTRQDDNGQVATIGLYPARASAECIVSTLASGGHKQTYFVERVEPLPPLVCDVGRFEVWRRDDVGNAMLVTRHERRRSAEFHVAELEAEPRHKNTYWIEERPPPR